ncbi:hypothetical protein [Corynebacterium sp. HMSC05H05]|uniref:hypothetical protein n=1 Tax=Corynebacterium sp. HMSC05H05 TaxID=1581119 RepID=UPI000A8E026F|nr:hypothetical protein [Corynebacterium sp. HMSC05H05]
MNQKGVKLLLDGQPIHGVLRLETDSATLSQPGTITLVENQIQVSFAIEPYSALAATFQPGTAIQIEDAEVEPVEISQKAVFNSRLGPVTLVQLGRPFMPTFRMGAPIECTFKPRFTLLDFIDLDHWRRPTEIRAEIGGLAAWQHGGSITRSFHSELRESAEGFNQYVFSTREFLPFMCNIKPLDASLQIETIPSVNGEDGGSDITIGFHTSLKVSVGPKGSWTELLEVLDTFQNLVRLLSWENFSWGFLHCKFGIPTDIDDGFWENLGMEPPPEPLRAEQWTRTLTAHTKPQPTKSRSMFTFALPFSALTEDAVNKWFDLNHVYAEGLNQVNHLLDLPNVTAEVETLLLGAAIERLGYKSIETKISKTKANDAPTVDQFGEVGAEAVRLFPDSFAAWAETANRHYQSMKHLRHEQPSPGDLKRVNDRSILAVQLWIAKQLGANDEHLRHFARSSPRFDSQYSRIPDPAQLK